LTALLLKDHDRRRSRAILPADVGNVEEGFFSRFFPLLPLNLLLEFVDLKKEFVIQILAFLFA
jgi:hypothetical protein